MNIAVIDDSIIDYERVSAFIEHYCQKNNISAKIIPFSNGESFLKNFEKNQYEIIFLDIYMKGIDAIEESDFVLQNNERIPIAKKQRQEIRECYADYAFKKLNRSI